MAASNALPTRFTSPGEAFAFQAREEKRLQRALDAATRDLMFHVKRLALAGDLTAGAAYERWQQAVAKAVEKIDLDPTSGPGLFLAEGLVHSDLGAEAYSTALAVLTEATQTFHSKAELSRALDEALSLETPSLVAAGSWLLDKLKRLGQPWRVRVQRTVRTGFTGVMGNLAMTALRASGAETKQWVSKHDDKTRPTHLAANGQTVALDAPFLVGGASLMYPGDRTGPPQETINCRCIIVKGRD